MFCCRGNDIGLDTKVLTDDCFDFFLSGGFIESVSLADVVDDCNSSVKRLKNVRYIARYLTETL